jgi:beta-lactamase class C
MPVTSKTLFPLASVSKSISATIIALMVERVQLSFEEKIKLPYLKHPVSLTNILVHTTGYQFSGNREIELGMAREKLLVILSSKMPKCEPGKYYSYSNIVFSLIEEVLYTKNLSFQSALQQLREVLKTNEVQILPIKADADIAYPHLTYINQNNFSYKQLPLPPYYTQLVPSAAGIFALLDGMIKIFKLSFGYRLDLISKENITIIQKPIISNHDHPRKWRIKCPYDIRK